MILPTGEPKQNKGFTLLEILLVVVVIGVILSLAAPNFSKGYSRFQINKTADDLLSLSRWAQAMAIGQERVYALTFSNDHRSYGLVRAKIITKPNDQDGFEPVNGSLGKMHSIPDSLQLDSHEDQIKFYPDGTIDTADIQLISSKEKIEISSAQVRGMLTKVDNE